MKHFAGGISQRISYISSLTFTSLAALLISQLLLSACSGTRASGGGNRTAATPAVPVTAANVIQKTVPIQVRAIGNVEAFNTIQVKAQVGGELIKVHFTEGQFVR